MSDLFTDVRRETSPRKSVPISYFAEIQLRHEPHRHECEVRHVASFDTDAHRSVYLGAVYDARGEENYKRLRADVWRYLKEKR